MQELLRQQDDGEEEEEGESIEREIYARRRQNEARPQGQDQGELPRAGSSESDVMNQLRRAIRADADAAIQIEATKGVRDAELQKKLFSELDATPRAAQFSVRERVEVESEIQKSLLKSGKSVPKIWDMVARARHNAKPVDAWQYT